MDRSGQSIDRALSCKFRQTRAKICGNQAKVPYCAAPTENKFLGDLFSLLASPGYLCIADLDREDGSFHGAGFAGHKGFDRDELGQKAGTAGFANITFASVFNISKGSPPRDFLVFLMVAEKL